MAVTRGELRSCLAPLVATAGHSQGSCIQTGRSLCTLNRGPVRGRLRIGVPRMVFDGEVVPDKTPD